MYKIGILDDDLRYAETLKNMINQIMKDWRIEVFDNIQGIDIKTYDAFFIDIELNDVQKNGFDIANGIKEIINIPIVFISSHLQYALDGYQYQAFAFLQKQKTSSYLSPCLFRLDNILKECNKKVLLLNSLKDEVPVMISHIEYVYKHGNYVNVFAGEMYHKRISASTFFQYLPNHFFTTSKGTVVNLDHIKKIEHNDNSLRMSDGFTITITRNNRRSFFLALCKRRCL